MNLISKIPIDSNAAVALGSVFKLTVLLMQVPKPLGVITDVKEVFTQVEEIHVKVDVVIANAGQGKNLQPQVL